MKKFSLKCPPFAPKHRGIGQLSLVNLVTDNTLFTMRHNKLSKTVTNVHCYCTKHQQLSEQWSCS